MQFYIRILDSNYIDALRLPLAIVICHREMIHHKCVTSISQQIAAYFIVCQILFVVLSMSVEWLKIVPKKNQINKIYVTEYPLRNVHKWCRINDAIKRHGTLSLSTENPQNNLVIYFNLFNINKHYHQMLQSSWLYESNSRHVFQFVHIILIIDTLIEVFSNQKNYLHTRKKLLNSRMKGAK